MSERCLRCWGCGKIASSEKGEPWVYWQELPLKSALAVVTGAVHPISCPDCGGTGLSADALRAQDVERRLGNEVVCPACNDAGWIHANAFYVVKCRGCEKLETDAEAKAIHDILCGCGRK